MHISLLLKFRRSSRTHLPNKGPLCEQFIGQKIVQKPSQTVSLQRNCFRLKPHDAKKTSLKESHTHAKIARKNSQVQQSDHLYKNKHIVQKAQAIMVRIQKEIKYEQAKHRKKGQRRTNTDQHMFKTIKKEKKRMMNGRKNRRMVFYFAKLVAPKKMITRKENNKMILR